MAGKQTIKYPGIADGADAPAKFEVPDGLTSKQLDELRAEAQTAGLALWDGDGNIRSEDVAKATWLGATAAALKDARDTAVTAEANTAEEMAALRAQFEPDAKPDTEAKTDEPAAVTPEPTPAADATPAAPEPVTVTAAAVAGGAPKVVAPPRKRGTVALTAAAGFQHLNAGETVDFSKLGEMFVDRATSFQGVQGNARAPIGKISALPDREALIASASTRDYDDITDALKAAADETQLDGGSLVASSGWCAPSEVMYDILDLTSTDGLITVPTVTAKRGGVRWTVGPSFADVYGVGVGTQTEAQNIADTTKGSAVISCPGFNEARMSADFLFLTNGILQQYAYPEAVQDYLTKALKAFEHYVSGKTIADQVAGSTAIDFTTTSGTQNPTGAAVTELLGAIELLATHARYRHRMSLTMGMEVKLPVFAKGILRSDLGKRPGFDSLDVSDAQLAKYFTDRNIAVEYVYDWQDAIVDLTATTTPMGGSTLPKIWPANLSFLMYPAGTWARAQADVIRIDALYDSALLAKNQQVQVFMERGRLSIKQGPDSYVAKVPVPPSGVTAAAVPTPVGTP